MNYNWRQFEIRSYAVVASLLISVFTILVPHYINNDAYVYVRTAEIVSSDGIAAAFQHISWASYSILIAGVSFFGFDTFTAAHLVNALFFALLVFAFLSIIKEIDDSEPVMALAALCVLVYPELNEFRYFIIRDTGFWALSVLSLWQFLRYSKSQLSLNALGFIFSLLLASLLRVEALIYLVIAPLALLLDQRHDKKTSSALVLRLYILTVAAIVLAVGMLGVVGIDMQQLLLEFVSKYGPFLESIVGAGDADNYELATALFNEHAASYSQEYVTLFMAAGLSAILLANLLSGIGGPWLILYVVSFFRPGLRIDRNIVVSIAAFVLINLVILFAFVFITRFLSSRYTMLMCILLSLAAPLIVAKLLSTVSSTKQKPLRIFFLVFFIYCFIDSYFSFGDSKDYLDDAAAWVSERRDTPQALVTNNQSLAYVSGKIANYDEVADNFSAQAIRDAQVGDLVALELRTEIRRLLEDEQLSRLLEMEVAFPSVEEARIAMYRRVSP